MTNNSDYCFSPIGVVKSCFTEKFGTPRQPGLVPAAEATLELIPPYNKADTVAGLEAFSHLWLCFVFNQVEGQGWQAKVRPPRLGGNEKVGVFASRSNYRPNAIGWSAVTLNAVEASDTGVNLKLANVDILHNSPVLDIKPYIPYSDCIADADGGYANESPKKLNVAWSDLAADQLQRMQMSEPNLQALIEQTLALDPRPAYHALSEQNREYGYRLKNINIRWTVANNLVTVVALSLIT